MKILFITDNYPPEVNAPATRTYEHCKEWAKEEIQITVLTCTPNFPQGKIYKGYKNKIYHSRMMDGIQVIRVWSFIAPNKGFSLRILDYISFAFSAFLAGIFIKTDIIIATSPQFFTTCTAYMLSIMKRKPWVFELRDLWPESIKTVGALKNRRILKLIERLELLLYRKSTLIIALTNSFKKNLESRGINPEKIQIVTNGSNLELYSGRKRNNRLVSALNLDNKFIIGYIGTHGYAHSLDFIINSIKNIQDNDIHFLFIGDGAIKSELVELSLKNNLNNITFLEPVAKEEVPEYMSIIDASLVPLKRSDTFKTVIPSKIFESSAMKKPILLGVEGEAKEIIERYNAGLCFEPENGKDFLKKLNLLKTDKRLYKKLQKGCLKLAKDFDRKILAQKMLKYITEIVDDRIN